MLDTGVDLSHPDIAKAMQEGRLKYHDFIEKHSKMLDLDGHGTHCVSLVLRHAPNAEVFVGRVFEKRNADSSCLQTLADVGHLYQFLVQR